MCVASGSVCRGAIIDRWTPFEAAHVVPLALEWVFTSTVLASCVTSIPTGDTGINSPQNGILLRSDIHKMFDQYFFSVNPFVSIHPSSNMGT